MFIYFNSDCSILISTPPTLSTTVCTVSKFTATNSVIFKSNSAIRESNVLTATKLDSLYKHGREVGVAPIFLCLKL